MRERLLKKKQREEAREKKAEEARRKKRSREESSDESSDVDVPYTDSDDDMDPVDDEYSTCQVCSGCDGAPELWVGCDLCPRWSHKECVDPSFLSLGDEELECLSYVCGNCDQ